MVGLARLARRGAGAQLARVLALLAIYGTIHKAASAPAPGVVDSAPVQRNLKGDTLVLNAGSLSFGGNHPMSPLLTTPQSCRDTCALLPGCNAWNFCNATAGCGAGCQAYVRAHPAIGTGTFPYQNFSLPILGTGPWPSPYGSDGCQAAVWSYPFGTPTPANATVNRDAWPWGLCTLVRVPDPGKPSYWGDPPSAGWVSGTIGLPPQCAGLSAGACAACLGSANPDDCLGCAKDARAQLQYGSQYVTSRGSALQAGCAACANVTSAPHRQRCVDCLLSGQPCGTCVTGTSWGPKPTDIAACLDCTAKHGGDYAGACAACAQAGGNATRCFGCLDTYPLKVCPPSTSTTSSSPASAAACWDPRGQTPCDMCANSAAPGAAFDQCLSCFRGGSRYECQSCTWIGSYAQTYDPAVQIRCFQCVLKAKFTGSAYGCAQCFSQWVPLARRPGCLACVESQSTQMDGRGQCAYCVKEGVSDDAAARCTQCLTQKREDYFGCQPS